MIMPPLAISGVGGARGRAARDIACRLYRTEDFKQPVGEASVPHLAARLEDLRVKADY